METDADPATGDEIVDFLAWMWPRGYEEALPHYRALAERLKGRQGQYVLVIERQVSRDDVFSISGVDESFMLGVLTSDRLLLRRTDDQVRSARGSLSFPTEQYAVHGESFHRRSGLELGAIRPFIFDTLFFYKVGVQMDLPVRDTGCFGSSGPDTGFCLSAEYDKPLSELDIVVGDKELDGWCRGGAMHARDGRPNGHRCDLIRRLARMLGVPRDALPAVHADGEGKRNATLAKVRENECRREELLLLLEDPAGGDPSALVGELRRLRAESVSAIARAVALDLANEPVVKRVRARHADTAK